MSQTERRRSPVYRQLEAYEEAWTRDHAEAMACRDWEDAIAIGLSVLRMLQERERVWREQVFRGEVSLTEDDNLDYLLRYANWLDTTREVVLEMLPGLEERFGTVQGVAELRSCANRVAKIILGWQAPRLSSSVGLREMTLSPEAAAELDRLVANPCPPQSPRPKMQEMSPADLKRPAPRP